MKPFCAWRVYWLPLLLCSAPLAAEESYAVTLQGAEAQVLLKDTIEPMEIIEFSSDLQEWVPVARNYAGVWETSFPHAYPITGVADSTDQALAMPRGAAGFYRKRAPASLVAPSNAALAARFLQQTTFGPRRSEIEAFPGVAAASALDLASYEAWIDQQIALSPFYHRAYWRQRSDPAFIDQSANANYLPNEVGHDTALGHRFAFYRGQTQYKTDWNCPLPGHGGLFAADGSPIDAAEHAGNLAWNGVPRIGSHAQDSTAHSGHVWNVSYPMEDTKKIVWYEAALHAPDQLRQRIAWALSQYFVVGVEGSNHPGTTERWLNYYDIFVRHAFGNFRDVLSEVTWSPHMGYYLSHIENRKADVMKGTFPDENYAREVMQLFTIGLWELNEDGTLQLDAEGKAIPTYDNDDIFEFAKVFTGLRRPRDRGNIEIFFGNYVDPMRIQAGWHDFSPKTLLDGTQLGPFSSNAQGVRNDVEGLLDHLFNHANTPPFFARFLIQRFTISNPSPAYIEAVAQAFKAGYYQGSGTGQRGDMVATIKAVLLHPEARSHHLAYDPNHGKLREPLIRLMHVARAFGLESRRPYEWIYFKGLKNLFLQGPYEAPSVFNFYRPDYSPNGVIGQQQLTAPEFQIHNDVSSLHLANALSTVIHHGISGGDADPSDPNSVPGNIGQKVNPYQDAVIGDYAYEASISHDTTALLEHLNTLLCAGRLSAVNLQTLATAIDSSNRSGVDKAKYLAGLITLTPEFNTLY